MTKRRTQQAPYVRRTVPLRGTVSTLKTQLDFPSSLAIAYARCWLKSGPGCMDVDVLASGVLRRALQQYMTHLNAVGTHPEAEARAVRSCCSSPLTDTLDRQAALDRLEGHQKGHPMPTYWDVLHGPHRAAQCAALTDRAEALAEQINRERAQRLAAGRKTRKQAPDSSVVCEVTP